MANRRGRTTRPRGSVEPRRKCTVRFSDGAYEIAEALAAVCGISRDDFLDRVVRHLGHQLGASPDSADVVQLDIQLDPSRIPEWLRDAHLPSELSTCSQEELDLDISLSA